MVSFSSSLINWHKKNGRKDLPWQKNRTPYTVWISEIMLQQTQVSTASPYFIRFIKRFPNLKTLSESNEDEILKYWSGLGYYSRAKNIHKSANIIIQEFDGNFPNSLEKLEYLPGIGKSTAGAILALGFNKIAPILDANVRRVISRYQAIEGDLLNSKNNKKLWQLAEKLLPTKDISIYTQAIMDLGATICSIKEPECTLCPINKKCIANNNNLINSIPKKKERKLKPIKKVYWLIVNNKKGEYLLKKRPGEGIWPGLWSFLEFNSFEETKNISKEMFNLEIKSYLKKKPIKHTFSHYNLEAIPINICLAPYRTKLPKELIWLGAKNINSIGLPSPIKKTIVKLSRI
ncbi:MAG: A/G-specific adenine glycosylase [SAR86 cluster bacterium]|jgi:A/G-specific adenine glycosylase|nr:A/G-specific adenine glycosylase [SAR86 cluster bacterium]